MKTILNSENTQKFFFHLLIECDSKFSPILLSDLRKASLHSFFLFLLFYSNKKDPKELICSLEHTAYY